MEQWKKDLRDDIRDLMGVEDQVPVKNKKLNLKPLLLFAVVGLFVANFFTIESRDPGIVLRTVKKTFYKEDVKEESSLVKILKEFDKRDNLTEKEIQMLKDRVLLLAIVSDENAAIANKTNGSSNLFIHIDADWKIDRMPSHVDVSGSEEFLRKRLKRQ